MRSANRLGETKNARRTTGGKRALEWITAKHGGDEALSTNLVHHMAKANWYETTESQLAAKKIRFTEQRRAASAIESHFKDKAHTWRLSRSKRSVM
jgi:hypothetical protein